MEEKTGRKFFDPNIVRKSKVLNQHLEGSDPNSTIPPFFSLIEFNLSGLCNRKCVFCPRSNPKVYPNRNEHLPVEVYEKTMRELAEVQYDGMILYSAFSEPLLYKQIEIVLEISKRHLPNVVIESVTDGDFVTPDKLRTLFSAGLDTLLISMYDGPEQEEHFKSIISQSGVPESSVVLRKRWLPPEQHYGITLSNRAGNVTLPGLNVGALKEPMKRPCFYPFYQVLVDFDGAVMLCPHDWGKKIVVGNLKDNTIHELWDSRIMRRVRRNLATNDRNFAPCDLCDVDGTLMGKPHFDQWMRYYEQESAAKN